MNDAIRPSRARCGLVPPNRGPLPHPPIFDVADEQMATSNRLPLPEGRGAEGRRTPIDLRLLVEVTQLLSNPQHPAYGLLTGPPDRKGRHGPA